MRDTQMLNAVFNYVQLNGQYKLVASQDQWELNGLVVYLTDEGYTEGIVWGDRLHCSHTYTDETVKYHKGTVRELELIYKGLIK